MSSCKVCESTSRAHEVCTVLGRHRAPLYSCPNCGFLYFDNPHWLAEAYNDAIVPYDTGVVVRNTESAVMTTAILAALFPDAPRQRFLDYAGGYGMFVRLMRDRGFDFYWSDAYAENLLARGFGHSPELGGYAAVTAFEVLEHVPDPLEFIRTVLTEAGNPNTLIFTTQLFDGAPPPLDWWYYGFDGGQHISFYQRRTLETIASKLGMKFFSCHGFHIFTKEPRASKVRLRLATAGRLRSRFPELMGMKLQSKTFDDRTALIERAARVQ